MSELSKLIEDVQDQLQNVSSKVDEQDVRIAELEEERDELQLEIDSKDERVSELENELDDLHEQFADLQAAYSDAE